MGIQVAVASLNQTPLDWSGNQANIQRAIDVAEKQGARLLVMPELAITGYGCEDAFLMEGVAEDAMDMLVQMRVPETMVVAVGLPLMVNRRLYNAVALVTGANPRGGIKVLGFVCKQNLAMAGIHYEQRWFTPWPQGVITQLNVPGQGTVTVPVGDLVFDVGGVRLGFEICEDAWVASRPGRSLFDRAVDIIINPSASHFAIGKQGTREQFVCEGSRAFGAAYLYSNLNGCEAGRAVFDGGNLIASGGEVVARGPRLFYRPVSVTCAVVDVQENRINQLTSSQPVGEVKAQSAGVVPVSFVTLENSSAVRTAFKPADLTQDQRWQLKADYQHEETVRAIALGLNDWLAKTRTNGFVLSLSGGADSGLVAALLYMMVRLQLAENPNALPEHVRRFIPGDKRLCWGDQDGVAKLVLSNMLTCVYQGTENSSDTTLNAAQTLAEGIGADFHAWEVDSLVWGYVSLVNSTQPRDLDWEQDDIALQNIQARVRAPGVWLMANRDNKLLLTTGNLSETAVGYMTMDGDTSGVLAPIAGVSKSRVLNLLAWLCRRGCRMSENTEVFLSCLQPIVDQQPTAELRPGDQSDEDDLMPFPVLDRIRQLALVQRRRPQSILGIVAAEFEDYDRAQLVAWLQRFYGLFARNQWKRERMAPGFHIEVDSLDPKTYGRFPILSGGMQKELDELS